MKKTFRSILAGAVALLAVSCYDDAALRSEIDKLDDRITVLENTLSNDVSGINSLASRLSDAENAIKDLNEDLGSVEGDIADLGSLATDLAALKTQVNDLVGRLDAADGKVDGIVKDLKEAVDALVEADKNFALKAEVAGALAQIAVVNVTEVNGNVVLTLADGKEVELSKPLKNVENTGLVTVIQDGAEKYWAVKDADGKVTSLGVPVGHPDVDIEFSVASNGDLQYSVNGGELIDAGVNTNELASCLVADVVEKEDCVIITIGEVEYTLPKYVVDDSTIVIKAGKTTFAYGETKEFSLEMKDITKFYVMTKPDGWKAVLNGKTLVVTAPSKEAVESFAEADGEVLLHANTADGMCKVAKLAVATTLGLSISVDEEAGTIDVTNALVISGSRTDWWTGEEIFYTQFPQVTIGFASIDMFENDPEGYVDAAMNGELPYTEIGVAGYVDVCYSNLYDKVFEYVEGECEVAEYHGIEISKLYRSTVYEDMPKGAKFIIWVVPTTADGYSTDFSNLTYAYYTPVVGSVELEGEPSFNEATVNVSLYGADAYYVGKIAESSTLDYITGESDVQGYIEQCLSYMQYGMNSLGMLVEEDGDYTYNVSEIVSDMEEAVSLAPNSKYFVYVVPVKDGKAWSDYDYTKDVLPYLYEFTTANLASGGSATVEFERGECGFTEIAVNVTPSADAATVYYNFFSPEEIDGIEDLAGELIAYGYVSEASEFVANRSVSSPGTQMALAAVAVDVEGKYGEVIVDVFASDELVYSDTFTASIGEATVAPFSSGYKYDFPITVTGGTAKNYYKVWSTTEYTDEKAAKLPLGWSAGFYSGFSQGAATILNGLYANASSTYYLYVVVESEDGEFAPVIKKKIEVPASAE